MTHLLTALQQTLLVRVAGGRRADDHHALEAAAHLSGQLFGVGQVVGLLRPVQGCALCTKGFQRIRKSRFQQVGLGGVDQQPTSDGPLGHGRQRLLLPVDGQQPLGHQLVGAPAAGAHPQALHGQQNGAVLVQQVQVDLERRPAFRA